MKTCGLLSLTITFLAGCASAPNEVWIDAAERIVPPAPSSAVVAVVSSKELLSSVSRADLGKRFSSGELHGSIVVSDPMEPEANSASERWHEDRDVVGSIMASQNGRNTVIPHFEMVPVGITCRLVRSSGRMFIHLNAKVATWAKKEIAPGALSSRYFTYTDVLGPIDEMLKGWQVLYATNSPDSHGSDLILIYWPTGK